MATDKRYPILPRSKDKPAGGGPVIAAYESEAKRRLDGLKADIAAIVDAIPAYKANKVTVTVTPEMLGEYYYALDSQRVADIAVSIQSAIDKWYGSESAEKPWSASHVTAGYEYGAGQAYANLSGLSDAYLMSTTVESIMAAPAVVQAIAVAHMQSYEAWNGFSADMRRDLANVIGQGIAQGLNPRIVAEQIAERFSIAESRAMAIAQTEVLGAVRAAKRLADEDAENRLGLRIGLLWTSALKATTRPTHAARHGNVFTREEVEAFYSRDGNRFRCYCAQTSVLLDDNGRPILKKSTVEKMKEEKYDWNPDK